MSLYELLYSALSSRAKGALQGVPSQQQQITQDETCCQGGASTQLIGTQTALFTARYSFYTLMRWENANKKAFFPRTHLCAPAGVRTRYPQGTKWTFNLMTTKSHVIHGIYGSPYFQKIKLQQTGVDMGAQCSKTLAIISCHVIEIYIANSL